MSCVNNKLPQPQQHHQLSRPPILWRCKARPALTGRVVVGRNFPVTPTAPDGPDSGISCRSLHAMRHAAGLDEVPEDTRILFSLDNICRCHSWCIRKEVLAEFKGHHACLGVIRHHREAPLAARREVYVNESAVKDLRQQTLPRRTRSIRCIAVERQS